jgi:ribosomal protein S27AE
VLFVSFVVNLFRFSSLRAKVLSMGGVNSGTPPSREIIETALRAVEDGSMSLRTAAKHYGVDRTTLAKYRDGEFFRRKVRRCPECGNVVTMPCLLCSTDVKVAAMHAAKRRLVKARRKAAPA